MPKQSALPNEYSQDWLERLDGRTSLARAVRSRFADLTTDLGGDLSYQRRSLAKRAVWMEATIEQMEAALARGEDVDLGRMTQAVNSLQGLLKTLGLDRVARDVPSLSDYLAQRGGKQ